MPAAPVLRESAHRFVDPVRSLLQQKGHAVWSISPESTVYSAIELMSEKQVGALVVLSGGFLAGIISERDYARKVILKGRNSQHTQVREIMSTPVLFVGPDQTIRDCMHLMISRRVRHLPVLEGEKVVGVVSIGDLVNWILQSQEETIQHLEHYITGDYPR
jgi:CBS domain-containing protein